MNTQVRIIHEGGDKSFAIYNDRVELIAQLDKRGDEYRGTLPEGHMLWVEELKPLPVATDLMGIL
jgi:hypothetical protein